MTDGTVPPPPPVRPEPWACCGRGCSPCIFDYYNEALARWRAAMLARGLEPPSIPDATPWRNW
ncbi:oxidoreductase-like domain-containing protein [Sphingomonas sp. AP4-R1]|uniref:oxidoreductase-like domain-containing protein n=1 Tax=Sphingomonas sp. AP4-R1 TaxID=2735134 RepID=UPI001C111F82|nr:oxidoreductase-like domain-containing protein [Sphingomonas sp. AP4-R1]